MDRFDKFLNMCCSHSEPEGSCDGCKIFEKFCGSGYGSCQAWIKDHEAEADAIINEFANRNETIEYRAVIHSINQEKPQVGKSIILFFSDDGSSCSDKGFMNVWDDFVVDYGHKKIDKDKITHWMYIPELRQ